MQKEFWKNLTYYLIPFCQKKTKQKHFSIFLALTMQVNLLLISLFCIANILTTRTCFLTLCLDLKLFLLKFAIKKLKFTLGLSGVLDWHLIKLYLKKKMSCY